MKRILLLSAALTALFALQTPAQAQDTGNGTSYVSLGGGLYNFSGSDNAPDFRIEYRSGTSLFWQIRPWAGAEATSDATVWAGGGLLADIGLTPQLFAIPSIGVGLYTKGSSDKDLDSPIEFRSQLELAYQFENQHRLGAAFSHTSNAGIGDHNPGAQTLELYWHIPTNSLMNGF